MKHNFVFESITLSLKKDSCRGFFTSEIGPFFLAMVRKGSLQEDF